VFYFYNPEFVENCDVVKFFYKYSYHSIERLPIETQEQRSDLFFLMKKIIDGFEKEILNCDLDYDTYDNINHYIIKLTKIIYKFENSFKLYFLTN
jgi:hypothetical protein